MEFVGLEEEGNRDGEDKQPKIVKIFGNKFYFFFKKVPDIHQEY